MMDLLFDLETWTTLLVLVALEIVLSIDNLVFIALLSNKLPQQKQANARRLGLLLAVGFRIALLSLAAWLVRLTTPLFALFGHGYSLRDFVLIAGGAFLIYKSVKEIRTRLAGHVEETSDKPGRVSVRLIVAQIVVIDIVFSIDSIITAVGLAQELAIMIAAVVIAVGVMIVASNPLARFINRNPEIVMLALAFLVMVGLTLVSGGNGFDVPKGYIYAAMGFSLAVEALNMRQRRRERQLRAELEEAQADLDYHG